MADDVYCEAGISVCFLEARKRLMVFPLYYSSPNPSKIRSVNAS